MKKKQKAKKVGKRVDLVRITACYDTKFIEIETNDTEIKRIFKQKNGIQTIYSAIYDALSILDGIKSHGSGKK